MNLTKENVILLLAVGLGAAAVMGILSGSLFDAASTVNSKTLQITSAQVVGDSEGNHILSFTVKNFSRDDIYDINASCSTTTPDEIETDGGDELRLSKWSGGYFFRVGEFEDLAPGQSKSANHSFRMSGSDDNVCILTVNGLLGDVKQIHRVPVDIVP